MTTLITAAKETRGLTVPGARFSKVPKVFGCQKSLCIFNRNTFRALKLGSYFALSSILTISKEQLFTTSES